MDEPRRHHPYIPIQDLYWAFQNSNHSLSKKLLAKFDPAAADAESSLAHLVLTTASVYNDTLVHLACKYGWLDIVKCLVEVYGCSPHIDNFYSQKPLHYACRYGHLDVVQYLVSEQQCDAIATTRHHWTPLHYACRYGHMSIVEYLTSIFKVLRNVDQPSLVYLTYKHNQVNILLYLMNKTGFTPDLSKTSDQQIAELVITAYRSKSTPLAVVHKLLMYISNYRNIELKECKAVFMFCCTIGLLDILRKLTLQVPLSEIAHSTDVFGKSGIHYACQNGRTAIVQHLVKCGCNINTPDSFGATPLHLACEHGHSVDLVKCFLSRSECNTLAKASDGSTALHFVCFTDKFDSQLMNTLLKHGASMSEETLSLVQTHFKSLKLEGSELSVRSAIVSCLLDFGTFDPNLRNYSGLTPVQVCVHPFLVKAIAACHTKTKFYKWVESENEYSVVQRIKNRSDLSKVELDLSETASNGDSILHMACVANKVLIAKCLLNECNFDPNVKNSAGDTPLALALRVLVYSKPPRDSNKLTRLVSVFTSNSRWKHRMTEIDRDGNTLLHLACQANQLKLVSVLEEAEDSLKLVRNKDGYTPLELLSDPKLIFDRVVSGALKYTFKPGSVHHFTWFCKNLDARQVEHFLFDFSKNVMWGHEEAIKCHNEKYMLHLPSHKTWLLLEVCFHAQAKQKGIFVIGVVDHMKDPSFKGDETTRELLYIACKRNKYPFVKHLLKFTPTSFNFDPIEVTNDTDIIQLLVLHGAKVHPHDIGKLFKENRVIHSDMFRTLKKSKQWCPDSICNDREDTALHLSVKHHQHELTLYLLTEAKCDPNNKNLFGETPVELLMSLKVWSDSECITVIGAVMSTRLWNPNSECNPDGDTALHLSVRQYRFKIAHYLVKVCKCDPNVMNTKNETPLLLLMSDSYCTDSECNSIIKAFKSTGRWDPNSTCNSKNETALHLSVWYHRRDVLYYLLAKIKCDPNVRNEAGRQPISMVMSVRLWTESECISVINILLSTGLWDPNSSCNSKNETALHLSVWYHRRNVVHYLLTEVKCDPNARNEQGRQPVSMLMSVKSWTDSECITIIHILRSTGLWYPNSLCDSKQNSILHLSVKHCRYKVVHYLLSEAMCDPNIENEDNKRPVRMVLSGKSWTDPECINIIKVLISTGLWDPNSTCNSKQETVLHLSVRHHRPMLAHYLILKVKCDPNVRNESGETAFQLLMAMHEWSDSECMNMIKALQSSGRWDPNLSCNYKGDSAFHILIWYHRCEVAKCLLSYANCDPNVKNLDGDSPMYLLLTVQLWSNSECLNVIKALMSAEKWDPNSSCNSEEDTALHLSVRYCRPVVVHFLLSELKCDPNITNIYKETPLQVANNISVINDLIRHGANPQNVYEFFGKSVGLTKPLVPPVKVFIIGNSGVGKSTLTEALKIETTNFILLRALMAPKKVSGVNEKTAGIVPHDFESKLYGRVIFYDFAGQREFYNSHIAILHNVIKTSPIFLIVIDLSNSEEQVKLDIQYWLSFTENNCYTAHCKPHIIIIGSHADVTLKQGEDPHHTISKMSKYIQEITQDYALVYLGVYLIDCRYPESTSMDDLRTRLRDSCRILRKPNRISFNAHCFHVFLLDKFKTSVAVTVDDLRNEIENTIDTKDIGVVNYLPDNVSALNSVCDELNDRGHILFLKNDTNLKKSWVILDTEALLSKVTGTIFAPNDFKQHCQIAESTGVVPLSQLIQNFPYYKSEVLTGFLIHLEFCHEINDRELLRLIMKHQDSQNSTTTKDLENEQYYLFPGLITLNAPRGIWNRTNNFKHYCFWTIRCTRQYQFFSSRFTQVLLLRLAFSFALIKTEVNSSIPALQRECSIWKNGIFWGEIFGMETVVEIQSNRVILLIRCQEENLLHCIAQRSSIIQAILKCVEDFCSNIEVAESFIDPSEATEFPLKSPVSSDTHQFTLQKIAEAIINSTEYDSPSVVLSTGTISLKYLLTFEPYAVLGMAALKRIILCMSKNDSNKRVSDSFLERLSQKLSKDTKLFVQVFKSVSGSSQLPSATSEDLFTVLQSWRDECDGTYMCLREKLDHFSVFAGRNVVELSALDRFQDDSESDDDAFSESSGSTSSLPPLEVFPDLQDKPKLHQLHLLKSDGARVKVIDMVAAKWESVAIKLHFESYDISRIERDHLQQSIQATVTVFTEWIKGKGRQPASWQTLIDALKETRLQSVANDLESMFDKCEPTQPLQEPLQVSHMKDFKPKMSQLQLLEGQGGRKIRINESVADQWKDLAVALDFNEERIDRIDSGASRVHEEACHQMFEEWLGEDDDLKEPVTWTTLVQCLIDAGMIEIADRLKEIISFNLS